MFSLRSLVSWKERRALAAAISCAVVLTLGTGEVSAALADDIIKKAVAKADRRSDVIIGNAQERADGIIRQAKVDAELEQKKAQEGIRREIIDLSSVLTKKMLKREINEADHKKLIDDFITKVGA